MSYRMRRYSLNLSQWMILIAIVFLALLGVGYIERRATLASLRGELAQTEEMVQGAQQHQDELLRYLEYVQKDLHIDAMARSLLGLAKPEDVAVDVIPEEAPLPTPEIAEPSQEEEQGQRRMPWQAWWDLFFGP